MTDPVPDTKTPRTRWMWVGVIALLAVVAVIMFINPDGDESLETIPDHAITTQEERINRPYPLTIDQQLDSIPEEVPEHATQAEPELAGHRVDSLVVEPITSEPGDDGAAGEVDGLPLALDALALLLIRPQNFLVTCGGRVKEYSVELLPRSLGSVACSGRRGSGVLGVLVDAFPGQLATGPQQPRPG